MLALGTALTGDQRPCILTILGSGGQGKTALALKLVERFAFAWSGGVWAIALDRLPSRSTFVFALAQFLGIETQKTLDPTDIEPLVLAPLKERRTLLVLDNAETLIEAVEAHNAETLDLVAFLKKLLGTLAYLLVTSRVPLGWDDEHTYELEGLSPEEGAALFRQGAPQRRGEIDLSVAASPSRQLEGHPLGLRLLAGAFNEISLSLPAFIQTTEERLREAENKYVGPEHRHRKLYACIETSVRSLTPALRSLLSGLWIFHAPFLADTSVAIFDLDTQETEQQASPIRDHLYRLQRRSLLTRKTVTTRDGTLRLYALLPTTRPYVEHYLEQAYDREVLRKRLITAYSRLARFAYDELNRSAMVVAFVQQGREDFEWVCQALADETIAGAERSRYLFWWGWIVYRLGNSLHGLRLLERAKEMIDGTDSALTLQISNNIALVYSGTGQPQKALQLYEEALPISREVGNRAGEATTLNNMAGVYSDIGQSQKALQLYEEALPIMREVGNRAGEATTLNGLAYLYQSLQRYSDAALAFEQSIALSQQIIYPAAEIAGLIGLAFLLYQYFNQPTDAITLLEQALHIFTVTGLSHDAAGQTVEQVQQWLAMMRDENISEPPSTFPAETIQQIVTTTIAVMTAASSHRPEWIEQVTNALQDAQQKGVDWQPERDFLTIILAFLDEQSPTLPPDHPYAQAVEAIRKGIASTGDETV
jgi:tetratricopeptide (TPR) repeat protein